MAGLFREEIIEEIRGRIDLVDFVGEYVNLRKQGNSFVGNCPFHADKTPSFHVTPENGLFYCFGCGVGGDLFSFVMKIDHLDFPQAVEKLARRAGVSLERELPGGAKQASADRLNRLREINREAALFFFRNLRGQEGKGARAYLQSRSVNEESQRLFALGYVPRGSNLLQLYLKQKGIETEEMLAAGLVIKRDDGTLIDRFRDRIMFPITDVRGRVVGFGGRLLGPGEPKYLNSPETKVFHKKSLLYGLHLALPVIRKEKSVILVEGYLDVIALHQHQIKNAVASLGTAFTPEHGRLIKRYAREVVILFDNDEAGRRATDRAIDIFREQGLNVKIASLPGAKDPDEFLQAYGRKAFLEALGKALPIIPYRLEQLKQEILLDEPGNKSVLLARLFPDLAKLTSQVERQEYIRLLAQELNLSEGAIWDDFRRNQGEQRRKYPLLRDKSPEIRNNTIGNKNVNSFRSPYLIAQENMLKVLVQEPALVTRVEEQLGSEVFADEKCREVFDLIKKLVAARPGEPVLTADLVHYAPETLKNFIAKLASAPDLPLGERQVEDTLNRLQLQYLTDQVEQRQKQIREAEEAKDSSGVQNLLQEISNLQRKIQSLK
ncbi:MAG: DNA primase [Clostridia bacterium]|nr:DNA primase [Clostridia bacterium]